MLSLGFTLIGAGLGGLVSYCYFVPKIHALAREAERQIKMATKNQPSINR
jgi:hypothetical protein